MKFILLADTHFGVRQNRKEYHDNMKLFYDKIFFPYLDTLDDAYDIIHFGDVFDDRRKIDTFTAKYSREYFFTPLVKYLERHSKKMYIICGNHDSYYKDSLSTNSLNEFIQNNRFTSSDYSPFIIIDKPMKIGSTILGIPWITKTNREEIFDTIAKSNSPFLVGHLELLGYNYSKVQVAQHGDDPALLKGFKHVLTGHYHLKHSMGNVTYLGSPTEHTWIDSGTSRGFHIFDDVTGDLEFISNPYQLHINIQYGQELEGEVYPRVFRVYYDNTNLKQSELDKYQEYLYTKGMALSVKYIPTKTNNDSNTTGEDIILENIEDTPTLIKSYVDDENISRIMIDLYNRALHEDHIS